MAGFKLKSIPYTDRNGVERTESFNIFDVKGYSNNFATGHITCSRQTNDYDKGLIEAGCKLNTKNRIEGNIYCAFKGDAYDKAVGAKNGAIIENVQFEIDPYPFLKKDGTFAYRTSKEGGVQINVLDFDFKQFDNNTTSNNTEDINAKLAAQRATEPNLVYGKDVESVQAEKVEDTPFGY